MHGGLKDTHADIMAMYDLLLVIVVVYEGGLIYGFPVLGSEELGIVWLVHGYWYEFRQDADWCSTVLGSIQMYTKKQECGVIETLSLHGVSAVGADVDYCAIYIPKFHLGILEGDS